MEDRLIGSLIQMQEIFFTPALVKPENIENLVDEASVDLIMYIKKLCDLKIVAPAEQVLISESKVENITIIHENQNLQQYF